MRTMAACRKSIPSGKRMTSSPLTFRFWVQLSRNRLITRSPGFTVATPGPISRTRPTHSAPSVAGKLSRIR